MGDSTLYDILEVSPSASFEVISAAYGTLSQRYCPDRVGNDPSAHKRAARINQAYEVLSDPGRRAAYDRDLHVGGELGAPRASDTGAMSEQEAVRLFEAAFGGDHAAANVLERAADAGDVCGILGWAWLLDRGGEPEKAFLRFLKLAEAGNAEAQAQVGEMLYWGRGTPTNSEAAERWFRKSAEQGCPHGEYYRGMMYLHGVSVGGESYAWPWIKAAAAKGHKEAQDVLRRQATTPVSQAATAAQGNAASAEARATQAVGHGTPLPGVGEKASSPFWMAPWGVLLGGLVGLLPMPDGYYWVFHVVVCVSSVFGAKLTYRRNRFVFSMLLVAAVVYNPVLPLTLGSKLLWVLVNGLTWLLFVSAAAVVAAERQPKADQQPPATASNSTLLEIWASFLGSAAFAAAVLAHRAAGPSGPDPGLWGVGFLLGYFLAVAGPGVLLAVAYSVWRWVTSRPYDGSMVQGLLWTPALLVAAVIWFGQGSLAEILSASPVPTTPSAQAQRLTQDTEEQRLRATRAELYGIYPEIDPGSPQFDRDIAQQLEERRAFLEARQGLVPLISLARAAQEVLGTRPIGQSRVRVGGTQTTRQQEMIQKEQGTLMESLREGCQPPTCRVVGPEAR